MERTRVDFEKLRVYVAEMMEKGLGYSRETSEIAATVLVEADARGHASHGTARVALYHRLISNGKADPRGVAEIVYETPVSMVIKGNNGSGFATSKMAMEKTIEKARTSGTCMTTIRESGHFGMAGYWAEMAADAGMMGVALTNRSLCSERSGFLAQIRSASPFPQGKNPISCSTWPRQL